MCGCNKNKKVINNNNQRRITTAPRIQQQPRTIVPIITPITSLENNLPTDKKLLHKLRQEAKLRSLGKI